MGSNEWSLQIKASFLRPKETLKKEKQKSSRSCWCQSFGWWGLSSALCRISFESYRCFVSPGIHRMQRRSQLRWRQHLRVTPRRWSKHIEFDLVTSIDPIGEVQVNGKGTGGYSLSVLTFLAFICFYWNVILPFLLCCFKFTKLQPEANQMV